DQVRATPFTGACLFLRGAAFQAAMPPFLGAFFPRRPSVAWNSALNTHAHGRRITFIRFAWCRYSRSNHDAPSSSGATALISGSTWIAPRDIISIHAGYSPFEAHD